MSKLPETTLVLAGLLVAGATGVHAAEDTAAGEKVFAKCKACHAVGPEAKNRVGPHLNDLFGRTAGTVDGFRYSPAMVEAGENGLVWDQEALSAFLADPKGYVEGTRMSFAGLKNEDDRANVLIYLATFDADSGAASTAPPEPETAAAAAEATPNDGADPAHGVAGGSQGIGAGARYKLGRAATEEDVAAWDIDVRPDGLGLPEGSGTVAEGMTLYDEACASCHGDFGEAVGRWPVLAGGQGTLSDARPVKTIGSYWPNLSTVYDYIRRAMPFGNARSLSNDDVYALTAYLLYLNDIVTDEEFELSRENFTTIEMPNADGFIPDDRAEEAHYAKGEEPCMSDCAPEPAKIRMHAAVLDVTPDESTDDDAPGTGID